MVQATLEEPRVTRERLMPRDEVVQEVLDALPRTSYAQLRHIREALRLMGLIEAE